MGLASSACSRVSWPRLVAAALVILGTPGTPADTLLVPSDFLTIQAALASAEAGDVVIVSPGIYVENIEFLGIDITLRSVDPTSPEVVAATVIGDGRLTPSIEFEGTETQATVLEGLTVIEGGVRGNGTHAAIRQCALTDAAGFVVRDCHGDFLNNTVTAGSRGGLENCDGLIAGNVISDNGFVTFFDLNNDKPGLRDCDGTIRNNVITGNGGGLWNCDGLIEDNLIAGNQIVSFTVSKVSGALGGGLRACDGIIQRNVIVNNETITFSAPFGSGSAGAGLFDCDGIVRDNIIANNRAIDEGGPGYASVGGAGLSRCDGVVEGNTIWGNVASDSEGEGEGGGLLACNGVIRNNIIWGNMASEEAQIAASATPEFCAIQNWTGGGVGNITDDPQFVNAGGGDFHLAPTSPCIDAGASVEALAFDFEGDPRPFDGTDEPRGDGSDIDIGADEFTGLLCAHLVGHIIGTIVLEGDFFAEADADGSGVIDAADLVRCVGGEGP